VNREILSQENPLVLNYLYRKRIPAELSSHNDDREAPALSLSENACARECDALQSNNESSPCGDTEPLVAERTLVSANSSRKRTMHSLAFTRDPSYSAGGGGYKIQVSSNPRVPSLRLAPAPTWIPVRTNRLAPSQSARFAKQAQAAPARARVFAYPGNPSALRARGTRG